MSTHDLHNLQFRGHDDEIPGSPHLPDLMPRVALRNRNFGLFSPRGEDWLLCCTHSAAKGVSLVGLPPLACLQEERAGAANGGVIYEVREDLRCVRVFFCVVVSVRLTLPPGFFVAYYTDRAAG